MDVCCEVPCSQVLQQCLSYLPSQLGWAICQLHVVKTAFTLWANLVLKRCSTVMAKVKDSISFKSFMDLQNTRLFNSELFPADILEKTVEKSFRVLHDEAIWKAVSQEKPQHKSEKLHFSQLSQQQQQSPSIPVGFLQENPLSVRQLLLCRHPPRLPLLPTKGKGRNVEVSSLPSQLQVGSALERQWRVWESFVADKWTVVVLQDSYRVQFHHLPPVSLEPRELPSCFLESIRVLALQEEVSKTLLKGALEPVDQLSPGFYN